MEEKGKGVGFARYPKPRKNLLLNIPEHRNPKPSSLDGGLMVGSRKSCFFSIWAHHDGRVLGLHGSKWMMKVIDRGFAMTEMMIIGGVGLR